MEAEKQKSDVARRNGQKRGEQIRSATRLAGGSAICSAQSQSQEQSQNQKPPLTPENKTFHSKEKQQLSQKDFDEMRLRKFKAAGEEMKLKFANGWGAHLTDDQVFDEQCILAGLHPQLMRETFARIDQESKTLARA